MCGNLLKINNILISIYLYSIICMVIIIELIIGCINHIIILHSPAHIKIHSIYIRYYISYLLKSLIHFTILILLCIGDILILNVRNGKSEQRLRHDLKILIPMFQQL